MVSEESEQVLIIIMCIHGDLIYLALFCITYYCRAYIYIYIYIYCSIPTWRLSFTIHRLHPLSDRGCRAGEWRVLDPCCNCLLFVHLALCIVKSPLKLCVHCHVCSQVVCAISGCPAQQTDGGRSEESDSGCSIAAARRSNLILNMTTAINVTNKLFDINYIMNRSIYYERSPRLRWRRQRCHRHQPQDPEGRRGQQPHESSACTNGARGRYVTQFVLVWYNHAHTSIYI